jgi:PDZ domain-containing protein
LTTASPPRKRGTWASPGRIAGTGVLLLALAVVVSWLVPANGYELLVVDEAHPVAPAVRVEGHETAHPPGSIYFVDVAEHQAQLIQRIVPWARPDGSSLVHSPGISSALDQRLAQTEMIDSQRVAPYVALKQLGYKVSAQSSGITILDVERDAPASRVLKPDDVIVGVDNRGVRTTAELEGILARKQPGDEVTIRFKRHGRLQQTRLKTIADPHDRSRTIIGFIPSDDLQVKLPLRVDIDVGRVGGPSAGLAFALDILQELGRNVAHGRKVAATGELALDGRVLPIGGVKQKTLGARRAGVDVFLVPAGKNAREARRYADGLPIIPVDTFQQALRALATLGPKV